MSVVDPGIRRQKNKDVRWLTWLLVICLILSDRAAPASGVEKLILNMVFVLEGLVSRLPMLEDHFDEG